MVGRSGGGGDSVFTLSLKMIFETSKRRNMLIFTCQHKILPVFGLSNFCIVIIAKGVTAKNITQQFAHTTRVLMLHITFNVPSKINI